MSSERETLRYSKYYTGGCLVKYEKDCVNDDFYVTEIMVKDGKAILRTTKNADEVIEEHELGIVDVKPLDLNIGIYGSRGDKNG